jgi:hypothetical protein
MQSAWIHVAEYAVLYQCTVGRQKKLRDSWKAKNLFTSWATVKLSKKYSRDIRKVRSIMFTLEF